MEHGRTAAEVRGVAQFGSARALGAWGRRFESCRPDREIRPLGQAVKTSPFHGGNMGSSPIEVVIFSIFQVTTLGL